MKERPSESRASAAATQKRLDARRKLCASSAGSPLGETMQVLRRAALAASLLTICAASAASLGSAAARPLLPAEQRALPYNGDLPTCDDWLVLKELSFDIGANQWTYWDSAASSLEIRDYDKVGEIGYRANGVDVIPRRYCSARARFNDGRTRVVKYNLIESGGFIGIGHGLEYCVVGLDHEHAFSPACAAAGP
jgi:hypothetical protein